MKRSLNFAIAITLLAALAGCGNDNKSGKRHLNDPWSWAGVNPYQAGAYTPQYGQYQVSQVINENPCIGGMQARTQVQIPLTNFPTVVSPQDVYVGVTSFGDVGAIVGTQSGVPTFIGYICMRSQASGQGQLSGISLGSYSNCMFKPISAATMAFADGTLARFRMMDFGSSRGTPFSPTLCRQRTY